MITRVNQEQKMRIVVNRLKRIEGQVRGIQKRWKKIVIVGANSALINVGFSIGGTTNQSLCQ
ncbi:metal-sensing transcriptional repressor [Lederbergia sp. NSJ-179]|uniref:metal-sensing transcriptional repressor n=1 Tax=Lederbergia sp. NSJ-179 TaxID=2931402 RepID=UPI0037BFC6C2